MRAVSRLTEKPEGRMGSLPLCTRGPRCTERGSWRLSMGHPTINHRVPSVRAAAATTATTAADARAKWAEASRPVFFLNLSHCAWQAGGPGDDPCDTEAYPICRLLPSLPEQSGRRCSPCTGSRSWQCHVSINHPPPHPSADYATGVRLLSHRWCHQLRRLPPLLLWLLRLRLSVGRHLRKRECNISGPHLARTRGLGWCSCVLWPAGEQHS